MSALIKLDLLLAALLVLILASGHRVDAQSLDDDDSACGPWAPVVELRTQPKLPEYKQAQSQQQMQVQVQGPVPQVDRLAIQADALVRRQAAMEAYLTDLVALKDGEAKPKLDDYLIAAGL